MKQSNSNSTAKVTAALGAPTQTELPSPHTSVDYAQPTQHNEIAHGLGAILSTPEERKTIPFGEPPIRISRNFSFFDGNQNLELPSTARENICPRLNHHLPALQTLRQINGNNC